MTCRHLLLLSGLLAGCVAAGTPLRDSQLSDEAVLINVPVVMQDDRYDCGVSALSMLLAYYGEPSDPAKAEVLRAKAGLEQGLTSGDLEDYLIAEGFETTLFKGDLSHTIGGLYYHLDRGRPLVVALRTGASSNHFVLVTGYDPVKDWVMVQDPERGALVFAASQFEYAWGEVSHLTLLATPGQ